MKLPLKVGLLAAAIWISIKLAAFYLSLSLDDLRPFVFINMFILTAAIAIALYLVKRKEIEQQRSSIMARGPQNTYGTSFLASMATNFLDPINIGAAFVPIVGEARFANMVARSGKNVARLQRGFVEGFVGNAGIEPIVLILPLHKQ